MTSREPILKDTLEQYLAEVNRYPLLSREEEYALAKRYQETGDPEAAKALVTANLRFVVKIAYQFAHYDIKLTDLVQDLLSLARLEHHPLAETVAVDLNQVVAEVCTTLQATASAKGLSLAFVAAPDLPSIQGHPAQLLQVVHNLVGNALNYTEHGQVQVQTRVVPAPPRVALEVADTGVGIAPEDLPHIFERMFRGSRTSGLPGTGLGLAIVQTIVTHHQGEMTVQSTPGEGTVFTVYFPIWTAS